MDLLVENAELVADAVPDRRALEGGQGFQVAGREPAQAAVAQTWLLLAGQHGVEILAQRGQCGPRLGLDIQVEQVVAEVRSEQELRRQIAGHLAGQVKIGLCGLVPPLLQAVAHGQ